jgi:hypothetical protein
MFRAAVMTCLMLVQLAGPLLCCCTTSRAAASPGPASPAQPDRPLGGKHSCCGGHAGDTSPRPAPESPKPADDRRDCPCPQSPARTAAVLSAFSEVTEQLQERQPHRAHLVLLSVTPAARTDHRSFLPPGECPSSFFLTADDILRALHILRC